MIRNWKHIFILFMFVWVIMNILQVIFTEMMSDEAYYLMYGENLAWGYYDHPPAVGLMTCISGLLFSGNMSVRFMTIVTQIFTILLIWKLLDEKRPNIRKVTLFFIITASMVMFTAYGFFTTPDVPFLFFTSLFLLYYQKFLNRDSWLNTLILGVSMAGMTYGKYHAALIIGLIVLSNIKILTRYKVWVAAAFALLLLIPHIRWQFIMDFPSFKYHLSGRSVDFEWKYFIEYIPNQLVVFNPLTFGAVVYILVTQKVNNVFERGLYFLIIGFIAFFWLMTFRGHVEPHWTVACTIPMIVLIYNHSLRNRKFLRFVTRWVAPSILLILVVRVLLITNCLPRHLDFYGKEERNKAIQSVAVQLPVAFTGSFQNPSDYHFFTRQEAFVLSSIHSRQTQFDIWQKELNHQGKPVFICSQIDGKSTQYEVNGHVFRGYRTENFQSVNRLKIEFSLPEREVDAGDTLDIHFKIYNPTEFDIDFHHTEFPVICKLAYTSQEIDLYDGKLNEDIDILKSGETLSRNFKTAVPRLPEGKYLLALTLDNSICVSRNSDFVSIKIISK